MSEFYIDISKAKSTANSMLGLKNELNSSVHQVNSARTRLGNNSDSGMDIVNARLKEISDSIIKEAAKANSLAAALTQIVMKYNAAETAICGSADKIEDNKETAEAETEKSWWDKLIDWIKSLFGVKEDKLSSDRQAEREHDLYMQDAIFDLMDEERFSESTWNHASMEERKAILSEFMLEIAMVMGITLNGPVNYFNEKPDNKGLVTNGYYVSDPKRLDFNTVSINTYVMNGNNSYKIMKTMIHEMRHAYQHAAVETPGDFKVSSETIEQWRNNFDHYIKGEDDFDGYRAQPIEYDANSFARNYGSTNGVTPTYGGSWE